MLQTSHHITAKAVTRQKAALEPIGPLPWPLQLTLTPVSRGVSDAYVYYKVKTDCTVFCSFWKDNSGSPYLSELNICL